MSELLDLVLQAHGDRRRCVHFNVADHPTAEWTARQIVQAFPWDTTPKYSVRDRDGVYGEGFRQQPELMDIHEVLTAPRSPWQNAYAERLVGSIRRECLGHVIVLSEPSLRRILRSYFDYCQVSRTHLSLAKDAPEPRAIQPPALGAVHEVPQVGGLHHRNEPRAA
jgi:putative transposase